MLLKCYDLSCMKRELLSNKKTLMNGLLINQAPTKPHPPTCTTRQRKLSVKPQRHRTLYKASEKWHQGTAWITGEVINKQGSGRTHTHTHTLKRKHVPEKGNDWTTDRFRKRPLRKLTKPENIFFSYKNDPQLCYCQCQMQDAVKQLFQTI